MTRGHGLGGTMIYNWMTIGMDKTKSRSTRNISFNIILHYNWSPSYFRGLLHSIPSMSYKLYCRSTSLVWLPFDHYPSQPISWRDELTWLAVFPSLASVFQSALVWSEWFVLTTPRATFLWLALAIEELPTPWNFWLSRAQAHQSYWDW